MLRTLATAGAMTLVLVLLMAGPALAETVDFTEAANSILDLIQSALGVGLTAALLFVAGFLPPFLREIVIWLARSRLIAAVDKIFARTRAEYLSGPWTVEVQNAYVARLVQEAADAVPGAIRTLGGTPEDLRRLLAGHLGEKIEGLPPVERPQGYVGIQGLT